MRIDHINSMVFHRLRYYFFKRVTHLLKLHEFCLKKTLCICFYHLYLNKKNKTQSSSEQTTETTEWRR